MATTPTQLPVPSEKPQDLKFNARKIDEFVTSMGWTYTDRFGNKHYTIEGMAWLARQSISAFGYITLKSFQLGAPVPDNQLTLPNQVLLDEATGEYYRWDGAFPKTVVAGSTPATTGGIGKGLWLGVGSAVIGSWSDGAGDALVAVKQPYTGAKNRTAHDKFAEYLTVTDFEGVDPTGATDSTIGLKAAISTQREIRLPAGNLILSDTLFIGNQKIIGAGAGSDPKKHTIITMTAAKPAFQYDATTGFSAGGRLQGVFINYGATKPNDNGARKAIYIGEEGQAGHPSQFIFEDIIVRGAYYVFYDHTGGFQYTLRNVKGLECWQGIDKRGGTTVGLDNCYMDKCYSAYKFDGVHGVTMDNCAYDSTDTSLPLIPFHIRNCRAFVATGMQHETGQINANGRSDVKIEGSRDVIINGFNIVNHTVTAASGEVYFFDCDNSVVDITGFRASDSLTTAGAVVYGVASRNGSQVNVKASTINKWVGATNFPLGASGSSVIHYNSTVEIGEPTTGDCRNNGRIGIANFTITALAVPASGRLDVGTLPLTGLIGSDSLLFSSSFTPTGCIIVPSFGGAGTVSLTIYNMTTTARTFTGNVIVSAMRF